MSSLAISDRVEVLDEAPDKNQMFVLGDVKSDPGWRRDLELGAYLQLYNVDLDHLWRRGLEYFRTGEGGEEPGQ